MATIFEDGFESNDFSAWTGSGASEGSNTIVENPVHHGTYAYKASITESWGNARIYKNFDDTYATAYARIYFQMDALPATNGLINMLGIVHAGDAFLARLNYVNDGGTYKWRLNNIIGGTNTTYTETIDLNTWYCLEVKAVVDGSAGELRFYRNGTEICTLTSQNTGTNNVWQLVIGIVPDGNDFQTTVNAYFDCVVAADARIGCEAAGGMQILCLRTQMEY